jgi:uncharacterized membrane protein
MNRWLGISLLLTAAAVAVPLYLYSARPDLLPEQVPTHWNARGQVDASVPRARALPYLLGFPGIMAGMVLLTLVLPWLSPAQFTVDRFRGTYNYVMMLVVALMGYLQAAMLLAIVNAGWDVGRLFVGGIFLFFALLGNVIGKVQRNFWMGVRTPWTLASETVWIQTHRLTAWLWTVGGLAGLVAVLAGVPPLWALGALLVLAFVPVIYSLVLYKRLQRQGRLPTSS